MCGVVGYIGYKEAAPVLLAALRKLEYRGYDSAGIAVLKDGGLAVRKAKGELSVLESRLADEAQSGKTIAGTLGIGHTRWATHGEPSDANSHPHTNTEGNIAIVHNGIIENYAAIKKRLENQGAVFQSDTDTEVIAHLINSNYENNDLLFAVRKTISRLEGSYALALSAASCPDYIVAVRKDSPLVVGLGKNENFLASDVPALLPYTREVYFLEEGEIAAIYRDKVDLFTPEGEKISRKSTHVDWDAESAEKGGYAHFMLKEIHEQPKAIRDTLRFHHDINSLKVDFNKINRVVLTACGTASHAALVGKRAFEHFAKIDAAVEIASEFRYSEPVIGKNDLVIVVSQSGETADTLAAMRLAKKRGAQILAITNVVGSTLARETSAAHGEVLYTQAGPEIAVASTKAFTTQLVCVYILALFAAKQLGAISEADFKAAFAALDAIPACVETALSRLPAIQRFASRQFNKSKVFFMGRQFDYAAALESALKLKEINYTHSEAFAAGELKHGPIALVDNDTLVVAFATQRALFDKILSNIREVTSRGAAALVITWDDAVSVFEAADSCEVFALPAAADAFSPLISIIPAQLFAYYCSVERGNNPDKPRNLAKSVTVE